ncbi:MAG TPA: hypothetical protein VIM86_16290 [Thermodesulfobacteriota bacterium]
MSGSTGGASAPEAPFPVGWFFASLAALAAAIVLGEQVLYRLGAGAGLILAPRVLVVLAFGTRLRTFRQVLGFGWGASLVLVAFRFVPAMLDPGSAAARLPEGAGATFWIGGLVFWWSAASLLYAIGMLAGHLARRFAAH